MQLGWIDFSKTERSKILSVLDLLSQDGTLDELGIAPVRDGFSNRFFPGTSTIQTRAKYFFIVPYALKELELSAETNPNRILKMLDETEKECGDIFLSQNKDEGGIIGKRSLQHGGWVKRTPADIYWAGLRRYGIFVDYKMSITEYVRAMCQQKAQKTAIKNLGNKNDNSTDSDEDDNDAGNTTKRQFWKIPTYSSNWLDDLSMQLTQAEGAFLKEQIIFTCPDTMLSFILKNDMVEVLDCESFRAIDSLMSKFPEHIQEEYNLALSFSDFMYIIRTLYNIMVSDGKNAYANEEFERLKESMSKKADIDIDHILLRLGIVKIDLRNFLIQIQSCMRNIDIEGMKKYIRFREIQLKQESRAKTAHPGEFEPDVWFGGGELNYRFNNAKTIIRDIFESEGKINVKSE